MDKKFLYILAYFLFFNASFVFLVPPFEANDEPYHLEYINYIVKNSSLPNQLNEKEKVNIEGHQFPLYYIFAGSLIKLIWGNSPVNFSLIYNKKHFTAGGTESLVPVFNHLYNNPFLDSESKTKFYFLRMLSLSLAALNLFFIYKIASLFFHNNKAVLLCVFFAASLPQFIFISSTISNDNLANLLSSAAIFTFLKYLKKPSLKSVIVFGILFSLCIITKKTLFFLIPAVFLSLVYSFYKKTIHKKSVFAFLFFAIALAALVSGWFFYRNYIQYNDIFLSEIEKLTVPMHYSPKPIYSLYFLYPFIPGLFGSFIGVFGWMNAAIPLFAYVIYFFIFLLCVAGIIKNKSFKKLSPEKIFTLSSILICLAGIVYYNLSYSQHQGRFLFPVLALIAAGTTAGLQKLLEKNFNKAKTFLYAIFVLVNFVSVYVIYRFYYIENNYL